MPFRTPKAPPVEIDDYCQADAQVVIHPGEYTNSPYVAEVYYACGGLNTGNLNTVISREVAKSRVTGEYLKQLAGVARTAVHAACETCPFNPNNQGPETTADIPD